MQNLVRTLPSVIIAAKAPTTVKKYDQGWNNWTNWAKENKLADLPADPFYVSLYINYVLQHSNTKGAIDTAYNSLRWGHQINGYESPTDHFFVKLAYEGALRLCEKKPKEPKEPFTSEILKKLFDESDESLMDLRFLIICSFGFCGFFRMDELLNVKLKDVKILSSHIEILLPKAKNDQHRDGRIVYISRLNTKYCPVQLLEKYLDKTGLSINKDSSCYLVPRITKTKSGHKVHQSLGISYSRANDIFKEKMKSSGIPGNFGTHSLRSGGASSAANNDVGERLINKHGRWKSERSKNMYIKDSIEKRLEVSKNLGI